MVIPGCEVREAGNRARKQSHCIRLRDEAFRAAAMRLPALAEAIEWHGTEAATIRECLTFLHGDASVEDGNDVGC